MSAVLGGCGGGAKISDQLLQYRTGAKWVYGFSSGQVTIPGGQGSAVPLRLDTSTITMEVLSTTTKDANNVDVKILSRTFDLVLTDGRHVQAISRLYFNQLAEGVFVHGFNNTMGTTTNTANDKFVPSSVNPQYSFLYIPDPLLNSTNLSYTNPFGAVATGSYSIVTGAARQAVSVPAGDFLVKPCTITEAFDGVTLTNAGFTPETGLVLGQLAATLADGTLVSGVITLKTVSL